ncbi:hypothetical protein ES705_40535 [subsurface metagenome]
MTESNIKNFKKEDKIKELGNKICRLVDYHEKRKGRFWELVAFADVSFAICRILRSHEERFKKMEEYLEHKDQNRLKYIESLKKQIESYKKIIREKKFTAGYRRSCQEAVESLEALLKENKGVDLNEAKIIR